MSANLNLSVIDDTWLVIPLFNESTVIFDVITEAKTVFPNIICIDDGSHDTSSDEAKRAGATVVKHPINLGQGAALQTGFSWVLRYTNAKYAITFDADGQHRVSDAQMMLAKAASENLEFVLGSRFLEGKHQAGFLKKIVLTTVAKISNLRTGLQLTDAHNGLRVLSRNTLEKINITQPRMAHASQIIEQLAQIGGSWAEVPVSIDYTEYSRAKGQSLLNGVNILTELLFATNKK
ncbi:MAG: glycosyltransferase family 2 protein [Arcanobacterium sp.]|nr:glycosyltransferase family 2 protein [Arcanobacterium sp.]